MQKKLISFLILVSITLVGCGTIPLPSAPDVYSFSSHTTSKTIGVVKVHDSRVNDKAGNISLYGLKLERKGFEDFVTSHLLYTLNTEMNVNVSRVTEVENSKGVDFVLTGTIEKLDVFSVDSLLDPAEAIFRLNLVLLNISGKEVYSCTYEGKEKKWIGVSVSDKVYGEMVETAVKNALNQVATDQELFKLIKP